MKFSFPTLVLALTLGLTTNLLAQEKEEASVPRQGPTRLEPSDLLNDPKVQLKDLKENSGGEVVAEPLIEQQTPLVEFVVDSSGSMGQLLNKKKTRMYVLKKLLSRYLTSQWTSKTSSGLRLFGSRREKDCNDNYLAIQPGSSKLGHIDDIVTKLEPVGKTPIADSLRDAYKDIKDHKGTKRIVLFTDGEETCGKDPCKVVEEIKSKDVNLQFFVVAFGLKDQTDSLLKLSCIGSMSMADSEEELENLFQELDKQLNPNKNLKVQSPDPKATVYLYKAEDPNTLYRKFEAQLGVEVPPGEYVAVVNLNPHFRFQKFSIPPKQRITLKVKGQGQFTVKFLERLLKVEVRDKDDKVIKTFTSDETVNLPIGIFNIKYFRVPFYEKVIEKYLIVPDGKYSIDVVDAGVTMVKDPQVRGLYVYTGAGQNLGNYLTNFPFVLKKGTYEVKVDDQCYFKDILVGQKAEIQTFKCGEINGKK